MVSYSSSEGQRSGLVASDQSRRGLFVDVETTGFDTETDEIIEVALLPFDYDPSTGDVIAVHEDQSLDELRDPGIPIPAESSQIHGITDDDVKGKVVDEARLNALVGDADLIIAHNAAFDRRLRLVNSTCQNEFLR